MSSAQDPLERLAELEVPPVPDAGTLRSGVRRRREVMRRRAASVSARPARSVTLPGSGTAAVEFQPMSCIMAQFSALGVRFSNPR